MCICMRKMQYREDVKVDRNARENMEMKQQFRCVCASKQSNKYVGTYRHSTGVFFVMYLLLLFLVLFIIVSLIM